MQASPKLTLPRAPWAPALGLVLLMAPLSSFATVRTQVQRNLFIKNFSAQCCVPLGPSVKINFPTAAAPIIVTWSSDYVAADTVFFGLSVNGADCALYGPAIGNVTAGGTESGFVSGTFQWILLPTDGLKKGVNTLAVCGGGVNKSVTFSTGSNTLTVQGSN
jgi:hypothetical protein